METLKKLFYDNLGGYSLAQLTKEGAKLGLSSAQVKGFYEAQKVNQVNKQTRKLRDHYIHIIAPKPGYISADLMDFSNFAHNNSGAKYILTVIDIYSRYAWAFPIKSKSPTDVLPHLKEVMADLEARKYQWHTFTIDYGKEFLGAVKEWLTQHKIKIYLAQERNNSTFKLRAAIIERFNRTLSERLTRATDITGNTKWAPLLPKIIATYNSAPHSTVGRSPASIFIKGKKPRKQIVGEVGAPYIPQILDYVRVAEDEGSQGGIAKKKGLRGKNVFSEEVYRVLAKEGYRYILAPPNSLKTIPGSYLARQLMKVSAPTETAPTSTLAAEKAEAKKEKKIKTENARSGLDVNKKTGKIEEVRPERLLGKLGREQDPNAPRTKKLPAKLRD